MENMFADIEPLSAQEVEEAWRKISGANGGPPPADFHPVRHTPLEEWFLSVFASSKGDAAKPEEKKPAPAAQPETESEREIEPDPDRIDGAMDP